MNEELIKGCVLHKKLKKEHDKILIDRPMFATNFVQCPLFWDRQLCLWCCLHIIDQAHPRQRQFASQLFPQYETLASKELSKSWDEVWSVCGSCKHNDKGS